MNERKSNRGLRVLWPTDGSAGSAAVAPVLSRIGPKIGMLRVLTVAPSEVLTGARPDPSLLASFSTSARKTALEEARAFAVQQALAVSDLNACKEPVSVWGNPIQAILRQAGQFKPDLTVMGSLGQSAMDFLLIGSVTSGVLQHTTQPMLVVRPGKEALQKVVLAYDGSAAARRTLQFLPRLLEPAGTHVVLVQVVEPFVMPEGTPIAYRRRGLKATREIMGDLRASAEASLSAGEAELAALGFEVETEMPIGDPKAELLDTAERHGADLVVVGSRKPSRIRHYLLSSTAERLVRHCAASVLVVR